MKKSNLGSDRIKIKKKGKYLKEILKVFIFFIIAVTSGIISSKIAVKDTLKSISKYDLDEKGYNFNEQFNKGMTKVSHSLVTISDSNEKLAVNTCFTGNVTGVIIDKQGHIVTSLSKIKDMKSIFIKLPSLAKEPIEGLLVGADETTDVAVVKVDSDGLMPVEINEEDAKEGSFVMAAGNAISNDFIGMITSGIITANNKKIYDEPNDNSYGVIQTNAVINDENVGGPLCNLEGELIGFNSYNLNSDKEDRELYYSLMASGLNMVVNYIISFTDKFGISGELIDDKESGVRGLYIENVKANGYAAKAGLLPTDIILSADGQKIISLEDINEVIKDKKSGENIQCEILRDGIKTNLEVFFN